jgi:hypothetical protein
VQADEPKSGAGEDGYTDIFSVAAVFDLLRNLFDVQMREVITSRMLPLIYTLLIAFDGIAVIYFIWLAFQRSLRDGLLWLCIIGPALFLAVVITVRIILELVMAAFRIAVRVEQVEETAQSIAGRTEVLSDLPSITFWRAFRTRSDRDRKG